jgi:magnesium-transporting ATPase (P-type)
MPSKPTFLKSFIITGCIWLVFSYVTWMMARKSFLTDANVLTESFFGFKIVVNNLTMHTFSVFGWMPSIHFFLCLVSWPFIQEFIHQKLHRRWVLHGGFERQKKFMDKVTRSHSRPHQS